MEGLVTLEDVLEEIVGEIEDEFTDEDPDEAARVEDGSWILNASAPLEEVNRIVGVQLNGHEVNTIGGYVYTELGRMPTSGDVIAKDDLCIEVVQGARTPYPAGAFIVGRSPGRARLTSRKSGFPDCLLHPHQLTAQHEKVIVQAGWHGDAQVYGSALAPAQPEISGLENVGMGRSVNVGPRPVINEYQDVIAPGK